MGRQRLVVRCENCGAKRGVPDAMEIKHRQRMVALESDEETLPAKLGLDAKPRTDSVLTCFRCKADLDVSTAFMMELPSRTRRTEAKIDLLEVK